MKSVHFLQSNMKPQNGNEKAWKVGERREVSKPEKIELCQYGYHACPTWEDAFLGDFIYGAVACVVEVQKPKADWHDKHKLVSPSRKLIKAVDASRELRMFACDCAERALKRERKAGREPDARSWEAIAASRRFADGKATVNECADASAAAWAAAWAAARDAACAAAWDAARNAAWAAAWAAERKWQARRFAYWMDKAIERAAQ